MMFFGKRSRRALPAPASCASPNPYRTDLEDALSFLLAVSLFAQGNRI
jgi:hypothetical protein